MTKTIKGFIEKKELVKWESGEWITMTLCKHGNIVESDDRVPVVVTVEEEITAKDGLLWRNGKALGLPEADRVARENGYNCAEEMVREKQQGGQENESLR